MTGCVEIIDINNSTNNTSTNLDKFCNCPDIQIYINTTCFLSCDESSKSFIETCNSIPLGDTCSSNEFYFYIDAFGNKCFTECENNQWANKGCTPFDWCK